MQEENLFLVESDLILQIGMMLKQIQTGEAQFYEETHKYVFLGAIKSILATDRTSGYVLMFNSSAVMYFDTKLQLLRQLLMLAGRMHEIMFYAPIMEFQKRRCKEFLTQLETEYFN